MVTGSTRGRPAHRLAWAAIGLAVFSGLLALYGGMHAEKHIAGSPLRQTRGPVGKPPQPANGAERLLDRAETSVFGGHIDAKILAYTEKSKVANYSLQIVAFVVPFVLGLAAAQLGGEAMKAIEQARGEYVGNTLSVFAMMIGGLAAVVAGCMMLSVYVWPRLGSLYTS